MAGTAFGSGGQNRLPDAVKKLRGTEKACRVNTDAPRAEPIAIPDPPEHLSDAERKVWAHLAPRVTAMRTATDGDLLAFELMVEDVAYAKELKADRDASPNQKIAAKRQAWTALAHFGLTPSAKSKVSSLQAPEQEDDPLAEFAN